MNNTELAKIIRENEELKVKVGKLNRKIKALEEDRVLEAIGMRREYDVTKANDRVAAIVGLLAILLQRHGWNVQWYDRSEDEWSFRIPSAQEYLIMLKRDGVEMIGFLDCNGEFDCLWPAQKKFPFGDVMMCQVATGEI